MNKFFMIFLLLLIQGCRINNKLYENLEKSCANGDARNCFYLGMAYNNGNEENCYYLGTLYDKGKDIKQDFLKANEFFRKVHSLKKSQDF